MNNDFAYPLNSFTVKTIHAMLLKHGVPTPNLNKITFMLSRHTDFSASHNTIYVPRQAVFSITDYYGSIEALDHIQQKLSYPEITPEEMQKLIIEQQRHAHYLSSSTIQETMRILEATLIHEYGHVVHNHARKGMVLAATPLVAYGALFSLPLVLKKPFPHFWNKNNFSLLKSFLLLPSAFAIRVTYNVKNGQFLHKAENEADDQVVRMVRDPQVLRDKANSVGSVLFSPYHHSAPDVRAQKFDNAAKRLEQGNNSVNKV